MILCGAFTASFITTAVFGHFRGGVQAEVPAIAVPATLVIILACVVFVTLRKIARMDETSAEHVLPLISKIVPMTHPPTEGESIDWVTNEQLRWLRSARWRVPLFAGVAILAALGVIFDGLAINSIGSTSLLLVAMILGAFAFGYAITYLFQSRSMPRRFGLSSSGIYIDYPPTASPRSFRYMAWSDVTSADRWVTITRLSSLQVTTRFGTDVWWGVPNDFVTRAVATFEDRNALR